MGLQGFFDETGTHAGHPVTGVAGLLYDELRLNEFRASWTERTRELKRPFHTVDCFWGRGEFEGWPRPIRHLLMHDLSEIIAQTKIAGFVTFVDRTNWNVWKTKNQTEVVQRVGSPYSACLLHCISMVAGFVKSKFPDERVTYTFEEGCDRQIEAEKFLADLERNSQSRKTFKLEGHRFAARGYEPLLCAADFIAWEWQRNYAEFLEDQKINRYGPWTSEFKILLKSKNMFIKGLIDGSFSARALINYFYESQPDD